MNETVNLFNQTQDMFFDELAVGQDKKYEFIIDNCFNVKTIKPASTEYLLLKATALYDEQELGLKIGEQFTLHVAKKSFMLKFTRAWRPYRYQGLETDQTSIHIILERINKKTLDLSIQKVFIKDNNHLKVSDKNESYLY